MPIYKTNVKKDGTYQYRVVVSYTDDYGKHRQKQKRVFGATEAKLAEFKLLEELNKKPTLKNITVGELCEEYLTAHAIDVRQSSLSKEKQTLYNYVLPTFEKTKLENLNPVKLQKWKTDISNLNFAHATNKNIYRYFSSLLNYAVKMEYIKRNPLSAVGNFKDVYFEKPQEKLQFYTPEQFKQFIEVAKKYCSSPHDYSFYIFFNIAYYTGMRKGEIHALKWSDIEDNIIHVRRSIAQNLNGEDVETVPKTESSYRDIGIPLPLINILNKYKETLKSQVKGFNDDYRVCGGVRPLRNTSIQKKFSAYANEAGLPHIRIHDFRHSHASLLANAGINIQEIAYRLGHSDIKMTWNTYSHLYPKEKERALEVLNKV